MSQILSDKRECCTISSCPSIERIITYLKEYQTVDIQKIGSIFNKCHRPFVTDDFNHVLIEHLGDHFPVDTTRKEFESIHNHIMSKLKHCELEKCVTYQRNNRNREQQNILLRNTDDSEDENEPLSLDNKEQYYIEILDTMHCFFVHTFDVGFRVKLKELNDIIATDLNPDADDRDLCQDLAMQKLSKLLRNKRERLQNIRGMDRTTKTKFITNISTVEEKQNKISKSKGIKIDDEKDDQKTDTKVKKSKIKSYSFGFRYNYWNEKDKNYVKPKYKNMKFELLNNAIFIINSKNYKLAKQKAKQKWSSKHARRLTSDGYAENEYNIAKASPISQKHIMSVLFYTDFDTLSYHFSSTFRALNKAERHNMTACKLKNAEFAHWSRLLSETVNAFGTKTKDCRYDTTYYHGVSGLLVFSSFLATFNSPTSTTLQVEVASIFAKKNGAILELQKHSDWLSYFNCSWLSAYSNEDERLFISPIESYFQLKFSSIRSIAKDENYQIFIHALTALNYSVNCDKPKKDSVTAMDVRIVRKLIMSEANKFPQYIHDIFGAFSKKKKKVGFKIKYFQKYYPKMSTVFFGAEDSVKVAEICRAFPHCKYISVDYNIEAKLFDMSAGYLRGLLVAIDTLNESKNTTLKSVKLDYAEITNRNILRKYKSEFIERKWFIETESVNMYGKRVIIRRFDEEKDSVDVEDEKYSYEYYKNYKKNDKKAKSQKIELRVRAHKGCFNRLRHPSNLLGGREIGFYSSENGSTVGDWIIFEMLQLSLVKSIKIMNYENKKFLKNSGIKRISLWVGNEESLKSDKWEPLTKDVSGIEETMSDQMFTIESNVSEQQIKNGKLNLLKLVIGKNHGHKDYNCFYGFETHGIIL